MFGLCNYIESGMEIKNEVSLEDQSASTGDATLPNVELLEVSKDEHVKMVVQEGIR